MLTGRMIMLIGFTLVWSASTIIYAVTHRGDVPAEMWSVYGVGVGGIWALTKDETSDSTYDGKHRKGN